MIRKQQGAIELVKHVEDASYYYTRRSAVFTKDGVYTWLREEIDIPLEDDDPQSLNGVTTTNEANNKTGIPLNAHGYSTDWLIEVKNSVSHDGIWRVDGATTPNKIIINKSFKLEAFGADDTVERAGWHNRYHTFRDGKVFSDVNADNQLKAVSTTTVVPLMVSTNHFLHMIRSYKLGENLEAEIVELITNGTMEADANWADYGTPTVNERSDAQVHGGTYSRKFGSDAIGDGIKSDVYTTATERRYKVKAWVYPDDSQNIKILVRKGDNSGFLGGDNWDALVQDAWNYVEFEYQETAGGAGAYVVIYDDAGLGAPWTWYIDDVSVQALSPQSDGGRLMYCLSGEDDPNYEVVDPLILCYDPYASTDRCECAGAQDLAMVVKASSAVDQKVGITLLRESKNWFGAFYIPDNDGHRKSLIDAKCFTLTGQAHSVRADLHQDAWGDQAVAAILLNRDADVPHLYIVSDIGGAVLQPTADQRDISAQAAIVLTDAIGTAYVLDMKWQNQDLILVSTNKVVKITTAGEVLQSITLGFTAQEGCVMPKGKILLRDSDNTLHIFSMEGERTEDVISGGEVISDLTIGAASYKTPEGVVCVLDPLIASEYQPWNTQMALRAIPGTPLHPEEMNDFLIFSSQALDEGITMADTLISKYTMSEATSKALLKLAHYTQGLSMFFGAAVSVEKDTYADHITDWRL